MTNATRLAIAACALAATGLTFIPLALTFAGAAHSAEARMVCGDAEGIAGEISAAEKQGGKVELLDEEQSKRWLEAVNKAEPVSAWSADQVMVIALPQGAVFGILLFTPHNVGCGPIQVGAQLARDALAAAKGQGM